MFLYCLLSFLYYLFTLLTVHFKIISDIRKLKGATPKID